MTVTKERRREYYQENRERMRSQAFGIRLRLRYGITEEQYWEIHAAQGGVCAICGGGCKTGQRLSVDHDHTSGKVRGLLCRACNFRLGFIEKPGLQAFFDYLEVE